jgi:hypothetical protein
MSEWQAGSVIPGPYLVARNQASTGIHTDEFARRQGFERAIVAGPNHLTFANTLIESALGPRWRERGRLQARFTTPVYDRDEVRAVITVNEVGDAFSADFMLENANAAVVASGAASWTPDDDRIGAGAARPSNAPSELLDLAALTPGERVPADEVRPAWEDVRRFCGQNHDQLAAPDRVPATFLTGLLFAPVRRWLYERKVGPGMWGEIDIRQHAAMTPDTTYRYEGVVRSLRRRGNLEIIDLELAASTSDGRLVCAIAHTHLIPHRDQRS